MNRRAMSVATVLALALGLTAAGRASHLTPECSGEGSQICTSTFEMSSSGLDGSVLHAEFHETFVDGELKIEWYDSGASLIKTWKCTLPAPASSVVLWCAAKTHQSTYRTGVHAIAVTSVVRATIPAQCTGPCNFHAQVRFERPV